MAARIVTDALRVGYRWPRQASISHTIGAGGCSRMATKKIQVAMLSLALLLPAEGAFARTHRVRTHHYTTTHRHHYSQTRGALVGAAVGAALLHNHVKGA